MTPANLDLARAFTTQGFELIETHISRVFLRGDAVYKTKRAVNLGFLDFSTLEARRAACEAEVELNRRLAPDVYLGLVAIVPNARGGVALVPAAEAEPASVIDWAVHMRRLPDRERADVLLARDELSRDAIDQIASLLVRFHADARADDHTAAYGSPERIAENVDENFAQVAASLPQYLAPDERATLEQFQRTFLSTRREQLAQRAKAGRVRDGHGDLRLEHLYRERDKGFIAIDCIEFNERFRFADVCADLAFLAMDLAYHDRIDLAERLVESYARESNDYELYDLLDFYESYRAFVRGKVASILAADQNVAEKTRERAKHEARRYYLLALSAAERSAEPARLIVCAGLIGSGKSTLASALGAELSTPVLSADLTRKQLLGVAPTTKRHDAAFAGAYSDEQSKEVYGTLLARADHVLKSGRSVILDASFRGRSERDQLRDLAKKHALRALFVECRCPRELSIERLSLRAEQASISDGRAEIFDAFAARFEPMTELLPNEHFALETDQPLESSLSRLFERLGHSPSSPAK